MALPITFNYDNTLEKTVGNEGLRPQDLKTGENFAVAAVQVFKSRVESGDVGFPFLPEDTGTLQAIEEFTDDVRPLIDDVLLVGTGSSTLGARALDNAMRGPHPVQVAPGAGSSSKKTGGIRPRLLILDDVDPGFVNATLTQLNPKRTVVLVAAKSGSTPETLALFLIVRQWMYAALGDKARGRIVVITGMQGDLLAIAKAEKYPLFVIPENVGARFSVFTPAGLLPAALIGLDVRKLLKGGRDANQVCWNTQIEKNPALASAVIHHALDRWQQKQVEVVFAYPHNLYGAASWYGQLWAASLGKRLNRKRKLVEMGQTPVIASGSTDQHSSLQLYLEGPRDKMVTFWEIEKPALDLKVPKDLLNYDSTSFLGGKTLTQLMRAGRAATEAALTAAMRPNCRWTLRKLDEHTLGMFLQMLQYQTAFTGELLGINAYDQPGVEAGKNIAFGLLGRKGYA